MYFLKKLEHVVRIAPNRFNTPRKDAITSELNKKLANKVLNNVGLCIMLYDILKTGDCYVIPGDGAAHLKVTFRYIVFRPFVNETIIGKVKLCDSEGIHVTLNFFDDILIPRRHMPDNSSFNPVQSTWIWKYRPPEATETHDMPTEKGDEIRFKVVQLIFLDTTPTPADHTELSTSDAAKNKPFRIIGRTNDPGLGLSSWWVSSEEGVGEEEDEEEDEDAETEDAEGGG